MSTTRNAIVKIIEEIVELRKVHEHLSQINLDFKQTNVSLGKLEKALEKESYDVKSLEETSLRSVFSKVLGNKEEQLEKERQEYLEALLKYNEKKKELELIEYEKELLERKTSNLDQLANKLESLKIKREKEILNSPSNAAQELRLIAKKSDEAVYLKREVKEAFEVGQGLLGVLDKILSNLSRAKNWGQYDMAGRGRGADYAKRQAIDRANAHVHQAHRYIQKYQKELADVGVRVQIELQMENFNGFVDFFFDNLITDWIVQKKIKNTLSHVQNTKQHVLQINQSLQDEFENLNHSLSKLSEQRSHLLENN